MKKRLLALGLIASLTASLFAGCGQTGSIADENAAKTSAGATETAEAPADTASSADIAVPADTGDHGTLKVSFPTGNIRVAINIIALEKGYFEEEGVTVEPVNIIGNDALTAINGDGDTLDILTAGFVPDLQAIGAGYDLAFIAGTAVEGGALITQKGNAEKYQDADTIINFDTITNAKIGFVRNESSWIVTRQYLLDNGVAPETIAAIEDEESGSISYYAETTETAQAVQKGEIEVGFLPMEFALLYADAYDLEIITAAGDLQENYVCCREVTSNAKLAAKPDAFVAYETARIRAFEYYKQGETDDTVKDDVVSIVSNYSGKEADYVETYLYGGVTKYDTDPNTNGIVKYVEAANNSGALQSSAIDFGTYDITQNIDTTAYETALNNLVNREPDNEFYASLSEHYNSDN